MPLAVRVIILAALGLLLAVLVRLLRGYFATSSLPRLFDPRDLDIDQTRGAGPLLVEFTSPYCYECQAALPMLEAASRAHTAPLAVVDAKTRPDLAGKYAIRYTPTILVVDRGGAVRAGWLGTPTEAELEAALTACNGKPR
ncbi:MAG: thioredoxin family protein [Actinomycetota bacterium]